jgi:hypothetical protein
MTAEELRKARIASEQMGDIEFQMEIAPYFGYSGEIDPSIARYRGIEGLPGDINLTKKGYYIPPNDPNNPYSEKQLEPEVGSVRGKRVELPNEPGTISAIHNAAKPNVWAHEYRHQRNRGMSEFENRIEDAFAAQNESDWEDAVDGWADQMYRSRIKQVGRKKAKRPSMSEAQDALLDTLETQTKHSDYVKEFKGGASLPKDEAGFFKFNDAGDYARYREKNTLAAKKIAERSEFRDWAEELEERNQERRNQ